MSQDLFYHQYVSKKSKLAATPLVYRILRRFEEHRYTTIQRLLNAEAYDNCLDIGCGAGDFLYTTQSKFKKVTGTDIVPQLIDQAKKKKFIIPTAFYSLDAGRERLPFRKNTFDIIVSIATLQYIYDLDLCFNEVYRTLKPGGLFIFEVPNFLVIWRRLQLLTGSFPSTSLFHEQWDGGVIHYFTEDRLRGFCDLHRLVIKKVTCSGIFGSLRKWLPSVLGANLIFICQKPR